MRAHTPGGRFTTDWELNEIGDGITWDATNPYGTSAEWWTFNSAASVADPIYDVEPIGTGRVWTGPVILPVLSASQKQGGVPASQRGFYSADTLKLTLNIDDLFRASPQLFNARAEFKPIISDANRYRLVWKGQVFRPVKTQPQGLIDERGTLVVLECIQVMPDELVNDTQFSSYSSAGLGYGEGYYGDDTYGGV